MPSFLFLGGRHRDGLEELAWPSRCGSRWSPSLLKSECRSPGIEEIPSSDNQRWSPIWKCCCPCCCSSCSNPCSCASWFVFAPNVTIYGGYWNKNQKLTFFFFPPSLKRIDQSGHNSLLSSQRWMNSWHKSFPQSRCEDVCLIWKITEPKRAMPCLGSCGRVGIGFVLVGGDLECLF